MRSLAITVLNNAPIRTGASRILAQTHTVLAPVHLRNNTYQVASIPALHTHRTTATLNPPLPLCSYFTSLRHTLQTRGINARARTLFPLSRPRPLILDPGTFEGRVRARLIMVGMEKVDSGATDSDPGGTSHKAPADSPPLHPSSPLPEPETADLQLSISPGNDKSDTEGDQPTSKRQLQPAVACPETSSPPPPQGLKKWMTDTLEILTPTKSFDPLYSKRQQEIYNRESASIYAKPSTHPFYSEPYKKALDKAMERLNNQKAAHEQKKRLHDT